MPSAFRFPDTTMPVTDKISETALDCLTFCANSPHPSGRIRLFMEWQVGRPDWTPHEIALLCEAVCGKLQANPDRGGICDRA